MKRETRLRNKTNKLCWFANFICILFVVFCGFSRTPKWVQAKTTILHLPHLQMKHFEFIRPKMKFFRENPEPENKIKPLVFCLGKVRTRNQFRIVQKWPNAIVCVFIVACDHILFLLLLFTLNRRAVFDVASVAIDAAGWRKIWASSILTDCSYLFMLSKRVHNSCALESIS